MGKEANKYYSRIAKKLTEKRDVPYSVMIPWTRRKTSFSMSKSIIMRICGCRSIKHEREKHNVEELASYSKARRQHNMINKRKVMNNLTLKKC